MNKWSKIFLTLMLSLCGLWMMPLPLLAQPISGIVVDETDKGPVVDVIVRNKNTGDFVYSQKDGKFKIDAKSGDSVLFFSQGYYPKGILVVPKMNTNITVALKRKTITIGDVKVSPNWTPYQRDSIERRESYAAALNRKKTTSVFSPFSLIADKISRKARRRWRFQKNFKKWERQKFIATRYNPKEVEQLTGLTGDSLAAFMDANPIPYDYARTASTLEIKMWIKYNYRQWIKHPYVPKLPSIAFPDSLSKDTSLKK